ncbi:MAG: hypothetical protein OXF42_05965 [Candidatus Dadabacteria bacterium]|nr:hypothetical protein [Candidatus Dadabacteria bacterium]
MAKEFAKVEKSVEKFVNKVVKKELAPTSIVKINMREDESGYDGKPLYRIDIIFDGNRPHPEQVSNMLISVGDYLWDIDDERFPLFTFLTPEDAKDYYDPVKLD